MKLAKALRLKNKIVGEINEIQTRIENDNSHRKEHQPKYPVQGLYDEYLEKTQKLVKLKTLITEANIKIAEKIHKMDEIKSHISFLAKLNTKDGTYKEDKYRNGEYEEVDIVYEATLDEIAVREQVYALKEELEAIQDELSSFNHTTEIDFQ
jgi:hypothetical protein